MFRIEARNLPNNEIESCCDQHDLCYDQCGTPKQHCDLIFDNCMYNVCGTDEKCKKMAMIFSSATKFMGCSAYKDAQKNACLCV